MENLLSKRNREILKYVLSTNVLLAFDYDGTLAPIVDDPRKAYMRESTMALFIQLAKRFPCIVISGRKRMETQGFLKGIPLREVIGNHGIEPWKSSVKIERQVARIKKRLLQEIPHISGVKVEDKKYSLSIHYRQCREKKKARAAILHATDSLTKVRVFGGKQVINIIPEDGPHKGFALRKIMKKFKLDTSIYIGDDVTDEDVFVLDLPGEILSIRVGHKKQSAAKYFINNQNSIDVLLRLMLSTVV